MVKEWRQKCKDCGTEFGYSDYALQVDLKQGFSRPERCAICRKQHTAEIKSIANSHFALKPLKNKRSILGTPYIGEISHDKRKLEQKEVEPDSTGLDIGMTDKHIKAIYDALENNQVLVIVAPTGTGKSTYIPFRLIEPIKGYERNTFTRHGPIIVTQPRVLAASGIPKAIAKKLLGGSCGPGSEIGYRHGDRSGRKSGEAYDRRNRLLFVTDGSLLNWIAEGKIGDYSGIIIDEAHERSKNIDLILGLIKNELLKYPHLKLIIASATIDSEGFKSYFSTITSTKFLDFSDCQKSFGYTEVDWKWKDLKENEISYLQTEEINDKSNKFLNIYIKKIIKEMADKILDVFKTTSEGGILGFLHGKKEVEDCIKIIRKEIGERKNAKLYSLYAGLEDRGKIDEACEEFKEKDMLSINGKKIYPRRIIIATNIAETSLTIKDIVHVVDSGLIKQSNWDPTICRQKLITQFHSKDGCKQRWGRAGRVQKGFVYKLYSKEEFIKYFPHHTSPEIERECLDDVILKAKASGVEDIDPKNFSWLQKPNSEELERATNVFNKRNLLDSEKDLTEEGREIYRLSNNISRFLKKCDPLSTNRSLDVATLLLKADKYACLIEAVTAIVMMPHMGSNLYVNEKTSEESPDFEGLLLCNKEWDLISKDYIRRLQQELKTGCLDDLDFACKLFALYKKELPNSLVRDWAERYFINKNNFEKIASVRDEILELFTKGTKSKYFRKIDFFLIEKVRYLITISWKDKIVNIINDNNQVIFENPETKVRGIISENSAGNWKKGEKIIIGLLDKSNLVIDQSKKGAPLTIFVIKTDNEALNSEITDSTTTLELINRKNKFNLLEKYTFLFGHLLAPVGSEIIIKNKNNKFIFDANISPLFIPKFTQFLNSDKKKFNTVKFCSDSEKKTEEERISIEQLKQINKIFQFQITKEKEIKNGIITNWKMIDNKSTAIIGDKNEQNLMNIDFNYFFKKENINLHFLRPIFNLQPKKIVGFIVRDENKNLLPIACENISIEENNSALINYQGFDFQFENLKIKQFSNLSSITLLTKLEEKLNTLIKKRCVDAEVIKITTEKIYFSFKEDNKFIYTTSYPVDKFINKIKEMDLSVDNFILNTKKEKIGLKIQFLQERKTPIYIKENKDLEKTLISFEINTNNDKIYFKKRLTFQETIKLQIKFPHLFKELRQLYSYSNHIIIKDFELKSVYEELKTKGLNLKEKAKTSNLSLKDELREFAEEIKKNSKFLLGESIDELYNIQKIGWEFNRLNLNKERLEENLKKNKERWESARSCEYRDKFQSWIVEGESEIKKTKEIIQNIEKN